MEAATILCPAGDSVEMRVLARQGEYNQPSVLFIHGLGDSSRAWARFFHDQRLTPFTLIAPDLAGYGRTIAPEDQRGGFSVHLRHLRSLGELTGGPLLVVGHSMGGLLASLLIGRLEHELEENRAHDPLHESIRPIGLLSVEGILTGEEASISGRAVKMAARGRFEPWFRAMVETMTGGPWARENPHLSHYSESLRVADPGAFLRDCRDLVEWKKTPEAGSLTRAQQALLEVKAPKVYLHGTAEVSLATQEFLHDHQIRRVAAEGGGHWTMHDDPDLFIELILEMLHASPF